MTRLPRLNRCNIFYMFLALAVCVALVSCKHQPLERTDFVLGTVCTIKILQGGNQKLLDDCFTYLRYLDDAVSANKEGTYVDTINKNAGREAVRVPPEVFELIVQALTYAERSNGAFDPTVGPLVKLWGIGTEAQRVPAEQELQAACTLIDWRDVVINSKESTVYLKRSGMRLDLGAIAKGWASEYLAGMLDGANAVAIIDLGGNIELVGQKPNKKPWKVGVQNPFGERNNSITILTFDKPMAVITSGVYERYFIENDKRYHHILNTMTGYPVDNGLVSVTVIADSGIKADALSTTLFVLGIEKGLVLAEQEGVEAVFIDAGHKVYTTSGARTLITDGLDEEFSFANQ